MACRLEAGNRVVSTIRTLDQHRQAVCLIVVARENHLDIVNGHLLGEGAVDAAIGTGTNHPLLVDRGLLFLRGVGGCRLNPYLRTRQHLDTPHRKGVEGDIFVVINLAFRTGQREGNLATLNHTLGRHHLLHRLLGRNPRTSGQRKAIRDMHAELQPQAVGLHEGGADALPPILGQLIRIAGILATTRVLARTNRHDVGTPQTGIGHRLQIGSQALIGHRAIHPIPERPRLGIARRMLEGGFEIRMVGATPQQERRCQNQKEAFHWSGFKCLRMGTPHQLTKIIKSTNKTKPKPMVWQEWKASGKMRKHSPTKKQRQPPWRLPLHCDSASASGGAPTTTYKPDRRSRKRDNPNPRDPYHTMPMPKDGRSSHPPHCACIRGCGASSRG